MQRKSSIVDANVVLRFLLKDDQNLYQKAEGFFHKVSAGKKLAIILQSVVAEVVYVLVKVYRISRQEVSEVLLEFLDSRGLKLQDRAMTLEALTLFARSNLDFVDCLICAYGREMEVISFDKGVMKCLEKK